MSRRIWVSGVLALLCMLNLWSGAVLGAGPPQIGTHAEAAALIDVKSGRLVYSKRGDRPMRIASLTKIMTAIVAIEEGKLTDVVKVSSRAAGKEGSSLYLKAGQEMNLKHMLYGLMLRSGNDAATAIAEHVGGSVEGFAVMMNRKAEQIGMEHSNFSNPSGLDEGEHFSTANDMAKLAAYSLKNPSFQEIVQTKMIKVPNPNDSWEYTWFNKNKMLSLFEGSDGVKTGYTKLAKRCLVSSATRSGQQFAVVTLNDGDDWADHAKLLNWGYENYPLVPLLERGKPVEGTNFVAAADFAYPLLTEEKDKISRITELYPPEWLESRLGERGKLVLKLGDTVIGAVPLVEAGSPRLKAADKSAFGFRASESDITLWNEMNVVFRKVLKAMLSP
ncbi:D-alanyl-D-alanine carboxypeptidase family protein [Paenibacillus sp. FJAT-26967]|uniref:D-alanyl-D-alanine carboxypeptidase family protein n=1 Tax=Paenibacillus sp. FJAT-26967 TaxID=1729690 RepID=UPI0008380DD6|nr:D-alanyl-D-alanine carboxypeptidase family protein [Paenibacillus sp. FJAT-26967]